MLLIHILLKPTLGYLHYPSDARKGDFLQQKLVDHVLLLIRNQTMLWIFHKLPMAGFAPEFRRTHTVKAILNNIF
jgi:hypothetical protein